MAFFLNSTAAFKIMIILVDIFPMKLDLGAVSEIQASIQSKANWQFGVIAFPKSVGKLFGTILLFCVASHVISEQVYCQSAIAIVSKPLRIVRWFEAVCPFPYRQTPQKRLSDD